MSGISSDKYLVVGIDGPLVEKSLWIHSVKGSTDTIPKEDSIEYSYNNFPNDSSDDKDLDVIFKHNSKIQIITKWIKSIKSRFIIQ